LNRFRDSGVVPPSSEWFYQPEADGPTFTGRSYEELFLAWSLWASANHIALPPNPRAEVEAFMCEYLPEGFCTRKGSHAAISLGAVVSFTEFMGRKLATQLRGAPVAAEPEEVDRRTAICAECPFNVKAFCSSCLGLEAIAASVLPPGPPPARERELGACAKCGCLLRVKIRFLRKVLEPLFGRRPDYPPHCWMEDK